MEVGTPEVIVKRIIKKCRWKFLTNFQEKNIRKKLLEKVFSTIKKKKSLEILKTFLKKKNLKKSEGFPIVIFPENKMSRKQTLPEDTLKKGF